MICHDPMCKQLVLQQTTYCIRLSFVLLHQLPSQLLWHLNAVNDNTIPIYQSFLHLYGFTSFPRKLTIGGILLDTPVTTPLGFSFGTSFLNILLGHPFGVTTLDVVQHLVYLIGYVPKVLVSNWYQSIWHLKNQ